MIKVLYRTKETTSRAEGLLESPKNSIRACTTLAAISENLIAVTWIDWMSNWRYSGAYNKEGKEALSIVTYPSNQVKKRS